jgi:hypothetical protein
MTNDSGRKEIDLATSVAGEEDPGASNEVGSARESPGRSDQPAGKRGDEPTAAQRPMSPGDEAPAGTPGTGEDVCPACGGSGQRAGRPCAACDGTGKVTVGIGGA